MNHTLEMHNLGPIKHCILEVKDFVVLTGPQSNGKSTVAKAIFFFKSVKQDILDIMMQGGPSAVANHPHPTWESALKQRLRDKFLQLFGISWIMPDDMRMKYTYSDSVFLEVFLRPTNDARNYVEFNFSRTFYSYIQDLNEHIFSNITKAQRLSTEKKLSSLLNDSRDVIFIPAGRNLITLLSAQLNYIFTSLDGVALRNIDYITRKYTELILRLKPVFTNGMDGAIDALQDDTEQWKKYKKHHSAIDLLKTRSEQILLGKYRFVEGEERLYIDQRRFIKINFSSSGQQEIIWVLNLLFYYLLNDRKVYLIVEEPESHLYPDSQQAIAEILALFLNEENGCLVTTHSPYILGTFNYLLLASQVTEQMRDKIKKKIHRRYWLSPQQTAAGYIHGGNLDDALDSTDSIVLIRNELIDGASSRINELTDFILDTMDDQGDCNE